VQVMSSAKAPTDLLGVENEWITDRIRELSQLRYDAIQHSIGRKYFYGH
jgi:hypothetical protein